MAAYNNFIQLLNDRKGTDEKRRPFVQKWLQDTYGLDYNLKSAYFDELTRPHNHDNLPLHFGRVQLATTLGLIFAELTKDSFGQYRIAVGQDSEMKGRVVLQGLAKQSVENSEVLRQYAAILSATEVGQQQAQQPAANGDPLGMFQDLNVPAAGEAVDSVLYPPFAIPAYLFAPEGSEMPGIRVDMAQFAA